VHEASYRHGLDRVARMLGRQWAPAILAALTGGGLRYSDLLSRVNRDEERAGNTRRLSSKMLSQTLPRMEQDGLVMRHEEPVTAAVWYELSPLGRSFMQALRPLVDWANAHREELPDPVDGHRSD